MFYEVGSQGMAERNGFVEPHPACWVSWLNPAYAIPNGADAEADAASSAPTSQMA